MRVKTSVDAVAGRRASRRAATVALVAALIGVLGAGTATGFWLNNTRIARQTLDSETTGTPVASQTGERPPAAVPDVRGLSEEVARQVLADSGSADSRVEIRTRAYAGLTGIIVDQAPAFGATVAEVIVLTVSTAAAVPEVAGRSESEVRTQLLELGTGVEVMRRYVPGAVAGTVLDVAPPPGSPLPDTLTLTVADAPSTAYLADVDASSDACRTGSFTQAAAKVDHALSCSVTKRAGTPPRGPMWEFAGAVEEVELSIGLPSDAEPGSSARVELFVDGRSVAQTDVAYGTTAKLATATPAALQFMLVLTPAGGDPERVTVTGTVRGSREAIIALTEKK